MEYVEFPPCTMPDQVIDSIEAIVFQVRRGEITDEMGMRQILFGLLGEDPDD